jgi:pyridoxine 4-dehydrogenase
VPPESKPGNGGADEIVDAATLRPVLDSAGSFPLGPIRVKRIGYGAMQLSGDNVFGPPRDRGEAIRVLRAAIESGVNHIDTAQYYGPGAANELIREALYPYPSDLAIVSKVAEPRDDQGPDVSHGESDRLRSGIEDNLATLGVDRLAAVNLRLTDGSRPGDRFDAQLDSLVAARDEGLIGGIGLSSITRVHLHRALDRTEIVCVQNRFNLADQRSLDILHDCTSRGIAFVPYFPLGWPRGVQNAVLANPILVDLSTRLEATPAQIALAWLLDLAPNVLLIPGTRTRVHLRKNILAASVHLDDAARQLLDLHFPIDPARARDAGP